LVIASFFVCQNANATKRTASMSGNWNQTATWGGLSAPGCVDTIVIPVGITVTITVTVNLTGCPPVAIIVNGSLNFATGKKLDLSNGSYVQLNAGGQLQSGGGGGSSNTISIGGTTYWSAGCTGSPPPDCGTMSGPDILCQSCFLPIELLNFEATLMNGYVDITWQTGSELNNDYFDIQRSEDGINWESVAIVNGADNSSFLLSYAVEDRQPLLGLSYYRLQQVDNDGAFTNSDVRVISNGQFFTDQQMLVMQSSAGSSQNVVIYFAEPLTGPVNIIVVAMSGSLIYSQTLNLENQKWVVISIDYNLAAGIYLVKADQKIERVFFE